MTFPNITRSSKHLRDFLNPTVRTFALAAGLSFGSAHAQTTTSVIDLGAFESGGTAYAAGDLISQIPLGSLPSGSILRSVTMNYRIEAGDPYIGSLLVLFADATGDNGALQIVGDFNDGNYMKTASPSVSWNSGDAFNVGATATQTLNATDGIPAIDLNTTEVWLHTGYAGSWAGTVTLEYDVFVPGTMRTFGPGAVVGELVNNEANITWIVPSDADVSALSPTFTLSSGTSDLVSGGTYDFTNPVVYTVTDGSDVNAYTVTATPATALVWDVVGGGTWDTTTENWLGQISGLPTTFANGNEVLFDKTDGGEITIDPGISPFSTTVNAESGTYTFSGGPLAGTGSLIKSGGGTLNITAADHTYSGGTIIDSGTLRMEFVDKQIGLGSGPVTLNDGQFFLDRFTCTNDLIVNGGSIVLENGFGSAITGNITNNAPNLDITAWYTGHPISGDISGPGGFTMNSVAGGRVILSGTNSYAGPTTVASGTLQVDDADSLGSGALSINTGGAKLDLNFSGTKSISSLTLGGVEQVIAGTYGSPTSDANFRSNYFSGDGIVSTGDPDSSAFITSFGTNVANSTATIGVVADNAATITWYVPSNVDLATLAPSFTLTAGSTSSDQTSETIPSPGFDAGSVVYTIVSANATVTNTYTVTAEVLPEESTLIWNLASGGQWNFSTPNWRGETSGVSLPYFDGVNVVFENAAGGTILLDGDLAPLSTTVNAASGTYIFAQAVDGGTLTSGSLIKDGGGELVLSHWQSFSGGTTIENGTLRLNWPGDANPKTSLGSGPVTLNGGTLLFNRNLFANELTVNGGSVFLDNGFANTLTGPIILNVDLNVTAQFSPNQLLSGDISGVGGITMTSSAGGGLILSGNNSYTGPTTVTGGTLRYDSPDAVSLGALIISSGGAKVNLNYEGTKTVASLTLGDELKTAPGTYGSVASGADFPDDTYFTDTGLGTVTIGGDVVEMDYDSWIGQFTFADGADTTFTGDPDGDGLSNFEEYAFGLDPTSGSSVNPITAQLDPASGNFQYTRRATPASTGITYTVLTSTDLDEWLPGGATESGVTTAGNIETVTVNVTALPVDGKLFVRVQATPAQ